MLKVWIKFSLKFFHLGWFSHFLCLLALIIWELGLMDTQREFFQKCLQKVLEKSFCDQSHKR